MAVVGAVISAISKNADSVTVFPQKRFSHLLSFVAKWGCWARSASSGLGTAGEGSKRLGMGQLVGAAQKGSALAGANRIKNIKELSLSFLA